MAAIIIDGKAVAQKFLDVIEKKVKNLDVKPGLAIVLVGNSPASELYVKSKLKKAEAVGFHCERHHLPENIPQDALVKLVDDLNQRKDIHGMIVQLPLPKHINEQFVIDTILPHKDADGLTPVNLGHLINDSNIIVPATARGCIELIKSTNTKIEGKHAVVIGRSKLVGKSVSILLQQEHATVTMCHSKTRDLASFTKNADILIVAVGRPGLITKDMVKPNAIVIDVGTSKISGKLVGDVDFNSVKEVAGFITPVPGGVGPMTITMLLDNTLIAHSLALR